MAFKKFNIFNYSKHKVGHEYQKDRKGTPFIVNRTYSLEEKIDYYQTRSNDKSLSDNQRKYAKIKLSMLLSGIGRIFTIKDGLLGNTKQPDKPRRVIPTAINYKNGDALINGIYTNENKYNKLLLQSYDDEGKICILNYDSYLNVESKKKDKNTFFNIKDLSETTSTINPYQLSKVLRYVYPKYEKNYQQKQNNKSRRDLRK